MKSWHTFLVTWVSAFILLLLVADTDLRVGVHYDIRKPVGSDIRAMICFVLATVYATANTALLWLINRGLSSSKGKPRE